MRHRETQEEEAQGDAGRLDARRCRETRHMETPHRETRCREIQEDGEGGARRVQGRERVREGERGRRLAGMRGVSEVIFFFLKIIL